MDNTTVALFIHELRNQCIYTEAAFRVFNQSLEQRIPAGVFFGAQGVLLSASQISALLWPIRARSRKRGEDLRAALRLPEKHALNDKRLAAIWEHGDEKFEEWVGNTKGQRVIFDHLGQLPADVQIPDENVYRLYDPAEMVFYYRGDGYKLQPIADAISDIYSRVGALHRQMFPEQYQGEQKQDQPAENAGSAAQQSRNKKTDKAREKAADKKKPRKKPGKKPGGKKKSSAKKGAKGGKKK